MNTIKPLQLNIITSNCQHDNNCYFVASAVIGVNFNGETLLSVEYLKDAFECMGDSVMPDIGMPKPKAEYLVTAKFFSKEASPVTAAEVKIKFAEHEKQLNIYGERQWRNGFPSSPSLLSELPLDYRSAYGGNSYSLNPDGVGYQSEFLPQIENPKQIVTSSEGEYEPAGFGPLDAYWPQRKRYEGTYDDQYLDKYFPGYPADFDWHHFMTAPEDQWQEEYFIGNESFELQNMHPEKTAIHGCLPGLKARCFMRHHIGRTKPINSAQLSFDELSLNLDTVHFFPEKELALLTFRGMVKVDDGAEITDLIFGYEELKQEPKTKLDYFKALLRRIETKDALLNNFNTQDLIPIGHKCAMELLQEMALEDAAVSEFGNNMDAKSNTVNDFVEGKSAEVIEQFQAEMQKSKDSEGLATEVKDFDLKSLLKQDVEATPDEDVVALNKKLEEILPGITSGDPKKLQLKDFSFDKIDLIMQEVNDLTDKKHAQAMDEVAKAQVQLKDQLAKGMEEMNELPEDEKLALQEQLTSLESIAASPEKVEAVIPRLKVDEIMDAMNELNPQLAIAMNQLNGLKAAGVENELTQNLEDMIDSQISDQQAQLEVRLKEAEQDFKELYRMGAHFQEPGLSPHKKELDVIKQAFLSRVAKGASLANGDWACIDLSGEDLHGVDLSGAFLEQVNFSGADLNNANFEGAILSRAILDGADVSQANFQKANVGNVSAIKANFTGCNFHEAKLSKSNFSEANFTGAILTDTETLEITLNDTNFNSANLTGLKLIERELKGADFTGAHLEVACFLESTITNVVFNNSMMHRCVWADTSVTEVSFLGADMTGNCFAVSPDAHEQGLGYLTRVDFSSAHVEKANFQSIVMPETTFAGARVVNCNFNGADLSGSNLSHADMSMTQFRNAKLTGADLRDSNFDQAFFAKTHLVSADLSGSNFYGADFLGAVFGSTKSDNCNFDATILKDWRPT